jgi:general secretion pathway protein D
VFFPVRAHGAGQEGITFNFVDVDLAAVAKFVSDVTGKNFIFDERVRGKITIIAPSRLDPDDAFTLFTSVLRLKGFTLLPSGIDAYKIVPVAEARQSGIGVSKRKPSVDESFTARLIPLKNISSDDALKFLKPVVSKNGHISSFGPGNLLLVLDSGLNVQKVMDIVKGIDLPPISEEPEVVMLEHAGAKTVADIMNSGLRKMGKKAGAAQARAVADTRLNAVVLFGNIGEKDSMKRLISMLDVSPRKAQSTINVYFLENADAEDLSAVLEGLIKGERKGGKKGAPSGQRSPFEAATGISITPDKATNSLVVVASPSDYKSVSEVIRQLDRKRRQVFVEAMIVEASLDKLKDLGSQWRVAGTHDGEPVVIGGVGTMDESALQSIVSGLSGFTIGGMGNYMEVPVTLDDGTSSQLTVPGFAALFNFSEFQGVVNVLSSPQILTSDNTEAEIIVGENVPFISKLDVTSDDTVLSSIERKDVGITLRLTPQITEGDYVRLEIYQEISQVEDVSEAIYTSVGPTTTLRSTRTTVVVRDNQTVVIGGLMQETEEESETRMPYLSRIPLLGWLFKHRSSSKEKTNLLVFLTPHIIRDSVDLGHITRDKSDRFAMEEDMYVEGELLVRFGPGVSEERAIDIISEKSAVFVEYVKDEDHYRIRLAEDMDAGEGVKVFMSLPEVAYARANYRIPEMSLLSPAISMDEKAHYRKGEVLVKFRTGVTDHEARGLIAGYGGTVLRHYEGLGIYLIRLKEGQPVEEGVGVFGSLSEVQYAEPNYIKGID